MPYTDADFEGLRRSAAMAPLSQAEAMRLIDELDQLTRERRQIADALAELPTSWANVRSTLNELHRIVAAEAVRRHPSGGRSSDRG